MRNLWVENSKIKHIYLYTKFNDVNIKYETVFLLCNYRQYSMSG